MAARRGTTTRLRRETKGGRKANKAKSRGVGGVLIKEASSGGGGVGGRERKVRESVRLSLGFRR